MRTPTVAQHFEGRAPAVKATYDALLKAAKKLGPFQEQAKKTSIHLNRKSAFAAKELDGPRVMKSEQLSASRWHVEIRLESPRDVDAKVRDWLAAAYELSA